MKKKIISLLLSLILILSIIETTNIASAETAFSPVAIEVYNNHKYALFDVSMTWEEAKIYCENVGGHLVTITSVEEQAKIESLMQSGNKNAYWLGGTDKEQEGDWRWCTNESFLYHNWSHLQPDNEGSAEHYLMIYAKNDPWGNKAGTWNDFIIDPKLKDKYNELFTNKMGFICEWSNTNKLIYTSR